MNLDESASATDDGQHESMKLSDVASEVQAHTSQLIIEKYRSLIAMEGSIADLRRDFNNQTLKLHTLQEELCAVILTKIQQIQEIQCTGIETSITYKQHQIFEFDGNRFQLKTLNIPILNVSKIECKSNDAMNRHTAKSQLTQAINLNDIEQMYRAFDVQIKLLSHKYHEVELKLKLKELHCLTLYQELLIIDQFEEPEKALLETIAALSTQMMHVEDEIKCSKLKLKLVIESNDSTELSMSWKNSTEIKRFFSSNGMATQF